VDVSFDQIRTIKKINKGNSVLQQEQVLQSRTEPIIEFLKINHWIISLIKQNLAI
jgi:hypothetical protein